MSIEFRLKYIREAIDKSINESLLKWNARKVLLNESFDEVSFCAIVYISCLWFTFVLYFLGEERSVSRMFGNWTRAVS